MGGDYPTSGNFYYLKLQNQFMELMERFGKYTQSIVFQIKETPSRCCMIRGISAIVHYKNLHLILRVGLKSRKPLI